MKLDRTIKPKPNGAIHFKLPDIKTFYLNNGLKIYYSNKTALPITEIKLLIHSGSRYDFINNNGVSQLTSMLIDEGAGNLSALEIDNELELLGSILNIDSTKEYTNMSLLTLNENLEKSLELFSLILQNPNFKEEDFTREKEKLFTNILHNYDNPSFIAGIEFKKILFDKTPYKFPNIGSIETVKKITNNSVKSFYKKNFFPSNASLIVVSNINEEKIISFSKKFFGTWNGEGNKKPLHVNFKKTKKRIFVIDKPDAPQSELRIGHLAKSRKSKDFYATSVLNTILGGQFSSRINLNLREDKGYTYGAHSSFNYNSFSGYFIVSTSVKSEHTGDAIKEILYELDKIKISIKNEEVEFAKSYLIKRYPALFETYSQLASNISLIPIFDLENNYFDNYTANILSVKQSEVIKAASENILSDELIIVIVGDKSKVIKQLNGFSSYEVIEK